MLRRLNLRKSGAPSICESVRVKWDMSSSHDVMIVRESQRLDWSLRLSKFSNAVQVGAMTEFVGEWRADGSEYG